MKLTFLFKRIILVILSMIALAMCFKMLHHCLKIPFESTSNDKAGSILVLFILSVWLTYEHLKESYGTLQRSPILWLIFLLINASLSSLTTLGDLIHHLTFYIPLLIQRGGLAAYLLYAHLSVINVAIDMTPWYITWRTIQALIKRHKEGFKNISI